MAAVAAAFVATLAIEELPFRAHAGPDRAAVPVTAEAPGGAESDGSGVTTRRRIGHA